MADQKVNIVLTIDGSGALTKATANVGKLEKELDKTSKAYNKTEKSADAYNKQEKALYQSNLSTAKGFSKMKETMGSGSSGLVGAYATLAANVFAATAAFNALRGAAQVQTLIEGFTFLGNAAGRTTMQIAEGMKDITDGALSTEVALRSAAIAFTSGFDTKQIEGLTEVAKNASIALGRNMADSIDRLFRGVAKLEPEILDELGIMVRLDTAVQKYAAQLGKGATELTDFERRQAFLNETLTQGALKYGDLSGRVDPNPFDKISAAFANLTEKGLNLINKFITPFITLLSNTSIGMTGGLLLFGSTILTTMIPALGQLSESQRQVANTALMQAEAEKVAAKQTAQRAKISFIRGGSEALTTKGKEFSAVAQLKKSLKAGKASSVEFEKAIRQVNNAMKRTKDIAVANETQNSKSHLKRIAELEALEAQIRGVQQAEMGRTGAAGSAALAGSLQSGQDAAADVAEGIQGAGAFAGFGMATTGIKDFINTQKDGFKEWKTGLGTPGLFTRWSKGISLAFGTAGVAARLFGAALMNAIPIFGQILFFGGLLISFLSRFFGSTTAQSRALDNLNETTSKAGEKLEQLSDTNSVLAKTLEDLDDSIRDTVISAQRLQNEITVVAGIFEETRGNLAAYTEALADANEKQGLFGAIIDRIRVAFNRLGRAIVERVKAIFDQFPILEKLVNLFKEIGNFIGEGAEAAADFFAGDQRARSFNDAIIASQNAIKGINEELEAAGRDERITFDAAGRFMELQDTIDETTGKLITFEKAQKIVNEEFKAATASVENTSKALKELPTTLEEVNKVFNKEVKQILQRNAFDKLADGVKSLINNLNTLNNESGMTATQIFEQLTSAAEKSGVKLSDYNITLERIKAAAGTKEGVSGVLTELETNLRKLAKGTREGKDEMQLLKDNLAEVKREAKDTKALDEFNAKLENFKRTGKVELSVVDNFDLAIKAAEAARISAEEQAKIKRQMVEKEFELELLKLEVFKIQLKDRDPDEFNRISERIKPIKESKLAVIDAEEVAAKNAATLDKLATLSRAGSTGTMFERGATAGAAMDDEEATTASRIDNIQNATSAMTDALKQLGPEGELVAAAFTGIMSVADAFTAAGEKGATMGDKIAAVGAIINATSAIMQANSKAQISEIDRQIEAEKKRDGKSQESLQKIAAMEKKKEQIERKAFEQSKKMQIASAIISTASGVVGALGDPTVPVTFARMALATMIGALGMAQVAIIRKQKFQGGSQSSAAAAVPQSISVGKRDNKIDVARKATAGELAYLRGEAGMGTTANNFTTVGNGAAGMIKNYATGGVVVGERGPEIIQPTAPMEIVANDKIGGNTSNINFTINAVDAAGVQQVLEGQRGNIIGMIREAAHDHGEEFLEPVDTSAYGGTDTTAGAGGYGG